MRSTSTLKSRRSRLLIPIRSAPGLERDAQLLGVVRLDQHVEAQRARVLTQRLQLLGSERRDDQQDRVGTGGSRLVQLVGIDDEVLAQQRQSAGLAGDAQILERAAEVGSLGEHRQRVSAAALVGARDLGAGRRPRAACPPRASVA